MASLQRKSDTFYCQFLFQGKRHTVTIGKVSAHEADAFAGNVEHLLYQLRRGYAQLPADASITEFVLHNGRIAERHKPPASAKVSPEALSLARLRDAYVAVHENGALEANSLYTLKLHLQVFHVHTNDVQRRQGLAVAPGIAVQIDTFHGKSLGCNPFLFGQGTLKIVI